MSLGFLGMMSAMVILGREEVLKAGVVARQTDIGSDTDSELQ